MTSRGRLPLQLAVVCSLLLVPIGLGWIPALRYAWGFDLWQYLPGAARWACAGGVLLLCWPPAREGAIRASRAVAQRLRFLHAGRGAFGVVALAVVFFLLRERAFFGDSKILAYAAAGGAVFRFPDVGATWIFHLSHEASEAFGIPGLALLQGIVCAAGAIALYCFARFASHLAPADGGAKLVVALIFCGGVLRVFFGHIEVYAFVLLCAGAYFWAATTHLRGGANLTAASLALGVGAWLHPSFVALLPSLLVAVRIRARADGAAAAPRYGAALALAALPLSIFVLAMLATGQLAALAEAWAAALRIAGLREGGAVEHYFVRGWLGSPSEGTDFVLLSPPHLKYLANAFFVLAPASVPVLLCFALGARRRFTETPEAVFLTTACAGLALYSLALRPIWGPYDWDLFSLTAVAMASLAALLLVRSLEASELAHVAAVVVGVSLLFVTLPLVAVGVAPGLAPDEAGPFARGVERADGESGWDALERQIEPWL